MSFPEAILLRRVLKVRLILLFLGIVKIESSGQDRDLVAYLWGGPVGSPSNGVQT